MLGRNKCLLIAQWSLIAYTAGPLDRFCSAFLNSTLFGIKFWDLFKPRCRNVHPGDFELYLNLRLSYFHPCLTDRNCLNTEFAYNTKIDGVLVGVQPLMHDEGTVEPRLFSLPHFPSPSRGLTSSVSNSLTFLFLS